MPHCIIEYTTTISQHMAPAELVRVSHQVMIDSGLFQQADIKTRAQ